MKKLPMQSKTGWGYAVFQNALETKPCWLRLCSLPKCSREQGWLRLCRFQNGLEKGPTLFTIMIPSAGLRNKGQSRRVILRNLISPILSPGSQLCAAQIYIRLKSVFNCLPPPPTLKLFKAILSSIVCGDSTGGSAVCVMTESIDSALLEHRLNLHCGYVLVNRVGTEMNHLSPEIVTLLMLLLELLACTLRL